MSLITDVAAKVKAMPGYTQSISGSILPLMEALNQEWYDRTKDEELVPFNLVSNGVSWSLEFMNSTMVDSESLVHLPDVEEDAVDMLVRNLIDELKKVQSHIMTLTL
jgi:hypothetical protein